MVFHIDRSDPVVAVALTAHVGSAREKAGRTGFAHLFEHLLFLESENLGKGGLDKMSARIGGSGANGSTNRDRTNYFQTVPKDALEKMLWAEADKLGWFINTVTDPVLAKEKQVVKNEKRQGVDNNPYGHTQYVIDQALYPEDHPYNWQVIGSLEDLQSATLADVKEFFRRWYVPNNVTLVVAGDFDPAQAKRWVEKYFSEIKRGEEIKPLPKRPGVVKETVSFYHEDNFARLPELTRVWPTVEEYHPDSYPLDVLAQYLSQGKKAPFYQVLVEEKKLTDDVADVERRLRSLPASSARGTRLSRIKTSTKFRRRSMKRSRDSRKTGISEKDLNRIKAGQETQFYNSLSSVLGKGFQLAQYNIFAKRSGFRRERHREHSGGDAGGCDARLSKVHQEQTICGDQLRAERQAGPGSGRLEESRSGRREDRSGRRSRMSTRAPRPHYERTPSTFDRSSRTAYGAAPEVKVPAIWEDKLANGLRVLGIQNTEVPLVQFDIVIDGGQLLEDINKVGVANLMARMMTQGTQKKTPQELEEAIQQLGATISVDRRRLRISAIRVNTLAKNYDATLALVEEILLEPRWDAKEFDLIKQSTISQIRQQQANPNAIAQNHFNLLIYGKDNIRSQNILGTVESVNAITLDDLKAFYAQKHLAFGRANERRWGFG